MARTCRNRKPLDQRSLDELALRYVARFATTRAKLEEYLLRKLRERGWEGEENPRPERVAERMVDAGYVDDAAYARSKTQGLLRRGYGMRRVGQALSAAGVGESLDAQDRPGEYTIRQAAIALARKRGFGAFGKGAADPARREKQIAAMLRAGHTMEHTLFVIDAADRQRLEDWLTEEFEDR